jgi:hypothetical protein
LEDAKNISEACRIPDTSNIVLSPLHVNCARALEEDMGHILKVCTQHTSPIRRVVALLNLFQSREAPSGQLPQEYFKFQQGVELPNIFSMSNQSPLVELEVQQVMRVNSANILDEGLRIGERGHQMNSKVKDQTN